MRRAAVIATATTGGLGLLVWGWQAFGPRTGAFAFLIVWVPMTWLGIVSRVAQPRLPSSYHRLRAFERDGHVYERLGVRAAKLLLRRGPLAFFNPHLHLPSERTPEHLARLERRMEDAEASHAILFVATLGIVLHAAVRGWWAAASLTLVFDVLLNGYPVMLQRYNRALLHRRFPTAAAPGRP